MGLTDDAERFLDKESADAREHASRRHRGPVEPWIIEFCDLATSSGVATFDLYQESSRRTQTILGWKRVLIDVDSVGVGWHLRYLYDGSRGDSTADLIISRSGLHQHDGALWSFVDFDSRQSRKIIGLTVDEANVRFVRHGYHTPSRQDYEVVVAAVARILSGVRTASIDTGLNISRLH